MYNCFQISNNLYQTEKPQNLWVSNFQQRSNSQHNKSFSLYSSLRTRISDPLRFSGSRNLHTNTSWIIAKLSWKEIPKLSTTHSLWKWFRKCSIRIQPKFISSKCKKVTAKDNLENHMCIKDKKSHVYCNYYNFTLSQAIEKKKKTKASFAENDLLYIMGCVVSLANYLRQKEIFIGQYRADRVYISPEGYIKMYLLELEP